MLSMNPPTISRTFSVEEANATLPLVRSIMRDVLRLERKVRHTRFRLKFIGRGGDELTQMFAQEIRAIRLELQQALRELDEFVEELLKLGIEPEGLPFGLVDFPTIHGDETVYLCWRYGEPSIRFWHTLTGGFVDRRPLNQLFDASPEYRPEHFSETKHAV